jgi:protein kinase A
VLDLCPGGELFENIKKAGKCPLDVTQFYVAEIVLALEYLHSHKIVHRDLSKLILDSFFLKTESCGRARECAAECAWTYCFDRLRYSSLG